METPNPILEEIYRDHSDFFSGDPKHCANLFGIECGPGWYKIILDVCCKLKEYFKTQDPKMLKDFHFTQIKEKFGGMRIYCSWYTDEIEAIIEEAEKVAQVTCEETGNSGTLRHVNGWYYTVSDEVYEQLLKKFE